MKKKPGLATSTASAASAVESPPGGVGRSRREAEQSSANDRDAKTSPAAGGSASASISSAHHALFRVRTDGCIVGANDAALRLLRYRREELEGRSLSAILVESAMGSWLMQALLESGFVIGEEVRLRTSDGGQIPVLCSGAVVRGEGGDPLDVVWAVRRRMTKEDFAARVRSLETELERERAERLRLATELTAVRQSQSRQEPGLQPQGAEGDPEARDHLWAWAEAELRRVQSAAQRTRERLFRVEEELQRVNKDRDWIDERRRRSEEELQRVREEMQRLERQLRAAESERGTIGMGTGNGGSPVSILNSPQPPWQPPPQLAALQVIQWSEALALVDGDLGFLRSLAEALVGDLPQLLRDLRNATERGDAALLESGARTLKGAAKSVGASMVAQAAARLEAIARAGDLSGAAEAYVSLQLEIERLKPALSVLRGLG